MTGQTSSIIVFWHTLAAQTSSFIFIVFWDTLAAQTFDFIVFWLTLAARTWNFIVFLHILATQSWRFIVCWHMLPVIKTGVNLLNISLCTLTLWGTAQCMYNRGTDQGIAENIGYRSI